ncbi:uncharacterized protein [Prorops nasuta]|uniref:uncharacterized protein n=1 Tax=Prorops nasuta TaxID=863751 RepID=UPI0034CD5B8D
MSSFKVQRVLYILTTLLLSGHAKIIEQDLSFSGCQGSGWSIKNVVVKSNNDTIELIADVASGWADDVSAPNLPPVIRQMRVTLTGCNPETYLCENVTNASLADVDCLSKKLAEYDKEACDVLELVVKWEEKTGDFSSRFFSDDAIEACVAYDDDDVDPEGSDSSEESSAGSRSGSIDGSNKLKDFQDNGANEIISYGYVIVFASCTIHYTLLSR